MRRKTFGDCTPNALLNTQASLFESGLPGGAREVHRGKLNPKRGNQGTGTGKKELLEWWFSTTATYLVGHRPRARACFSVGVSLAIQLTAPLAIVSGRVTA